MIQLEALARQLDVELRGNGDKQIKGLGTLASATSDQVSFLANPSYASLLASTQAGAVILHPKQASQFEGVCLVTTNPYVAWAKAAAILRPRRRNTPGVHATAWIDLTAEVDDSAHIGAHCSIGPGCRVGAGVEIGPGSVLEQQVSIGRDSRLCGRVYIADGCRIGERVIIHPGAVIGADGFGLAMDQGHWIKVPQLGAVVIGDDCEIGANTTIDRGAVEDTVLAEDVRLDNQVQVAHNVHIGAHTAIAGCTGIAGSTRIGSYCMIAGACGIGGHLEICDKVVITAMSTVLDSIHEPGEYGSGIPARRHGSWKRILVRLGQLDDWARRLKRIEKNQTQAEELNNDDK